MERASNAIAATSVWRDVLSPFCFAANLAPAQLIRQSGCARNFIADKFLLWLAQCRSDVSSIHLRTQSPRAACQREATTSLQATIPRGSPPAPNFDLVYFWPVCLSDATIRTIVPILWSTITIYCDDGVRRVSTSPYLLLPGEHCKYKKPFLRS